MSIKTEEPKTEGFTTKKVANPNSSQTNLEKTNKLCYFHPEIYKNVTYFLNSQKLPDEKTILNFKNFFLVLRDEVGLGNKVSQISFESLALIANYFKTQYSSNKDFFENILGHFEALKKENPRFLSSFSIEETKKLIAEFFKFQYSKNIDLFGGKNETKIFNLHLFTDIRILFENFKNEFMPDFYRNYAAAILNVFVVNANMVIPPTRDMDVSNWYSIELNSNSYMVNGAFSIINLQKGIIHSPESETEKYVVRTQGKSYDLIHSNNLWYIDIGGRLFPVLELLNVDIYKASKNQYEKSFRKKGFFSKQKSLIATEIFSLKDFFKKQIVFAKEMEDLPINHNMLLRRKGIKYHITPKIDYVIKDKNMD